MRMITAALILAGLSSAAWAQDHTWVETTFHRVHLRNGNFIDGKLLSMSDHEVSLQLQQGNMNLRRDSIEKIEFIKMRSLLEKPKQENFKSIPAAATPGVKPASVGVLNITPPSIEEALKSKVTGILAGMKTGNADQKTALMRELTAQEGAAPYVASQLDTIGEEEVDLVGMALSEMKDRESLPYIVANLDSGRESVLILALKLVADLQGTSYTGKVRSFLSHPIAVVRGTAISTLDRLSDRDSLTNIIDLLKESDRPVRSAAINACLAMGSRFNETEAVVAGFSRALDLASPEGRVDLLSGLGRLKTAKAWETVSPYLRDNEISVREAAAEAMLALAAADSADELASRMQSESEKSVRLRLARAATAVRSLKLVDPLISWLRSEDEDIVKGATKALESITGKRFNDHREWSAWWEQNRGR